MKNLFLLLASLLILNIAIGQTKRELQLSIDNSNLKIEALKSELNAQKNENALLKNNLEKCQSDIKSLMDRVTALENKANEQNYSVAPTSNSTSSGQCKATTSKGTRCSRAADPGSEYCWQHKSTYEPAASPSNSGSNKTNSGSYQSTKTYSGDRTIHTGPRGGKYYINSNGKKTYIKK